MKKLLVVVSLSVLLTGCSDIPENSIADGNTTDEEIEMMEQAWCDYNKGRKFVTDQCE